MVKRTLEDRIESFRTYMGDIVPDDMIQELKEQGFFTSPASRKYHGAYEGGLFDHSLNVTRMLVTITDTMHRKWQRKESPLIVGMFHDLCKIDAYKRVFKLEKLNDDCTVHVSMYEHNDKQLLKGHGEKSVMLLSKYIQLTEEEILCIRYHMGAYMKDEWEQYDLAIKKYENVLWTHTADMYASKVMENESD